MECQTPFSSFFIRTIGQRGPKIRPTKTQTLPKLGISTDSILYCFSTVIRGARFSPRVHRAHHHRSSCVGESRSSDDYPAKQSTNSFSSRVVHRAFERGLGFWHIFQRNEMHSIEVHSIMYLGIGEPLNVYWRCWPVYNLFAIHSVYTLFPWIISVLNLSGNQTRRGPARISNCQICPPRRSVQCSRSLRHRDGCWEGRLIRGQKLKKFTDLTIFLW